MTEWVLDHYNIHTAWTYYVAPSQPHHVFRIRAWHLFTIRVCLHTAAPRGRTSVDKVLWHPLGRCRPPWSGCAAMKLHARVRCRFSDWFGVKIIHIKNVLMPVCRGMILWFVSPLQSRAANECNGWCFQPKVTGMYDRGVIFNSNWQNVGAAGAKGHLAPGVSINEREVVLEQDPEQAPATGNWMVSRGERPNNMH